MSETKVNQSKGIIGLDSEMYVCTKFHDKSSNSC